MNETRSKTSPAAPRPAARASPGSARKAARKPASGPWSEIANFVLTFETRQLRNGREERRITAHKMQEGGITATWTGAQQHPMCQWIAEHVGDGLPGVPQAVEDAQRPARRKQAQAIGTDDRQAPGPALSLDIAIAQLRALPVAANLTDELPPEAEDLTTFDLEALLDVHAASGPTTVDAIEPRAPIEFYLRDMRTARRSCLGRVARAERLDGMRYAATLRQVRLPAGTYRIDCATRTPGAEQPFVYLQGPVLQVA